MLQTHCFSIGQRIAWVEVFEDSSYPNNKAELTTVGIIVALTFGDFNTFTNGDLLPDKSILSIPSYQVLVEQSLDNLNPEPDDTYAIFFVTEKELIEYGVKTLSSNPVCGM